MEEELFFMKEFGGYCVDNNETEETNIKQDYKVKNKCLLPSHYHKDAEKVLKATVRKDDVWLVSHPRTGSTWCHEMIWLIMNNLDFHTSQTTFQVLRAPGIELSLALQYQYADSVNVEGFDFPVPRYNYGWTPGKHLSSLAKSSDISAEVKSGMRKALTDTVGYLESLPSPRCMKSHLCTHLLPEGIETVKPKVIYVIREPKDVCTSYYFYLKLTHAFQIDFEQFCELFMNDALPFGSIFHHYLDFWNKRHEPNILILRYEEMVVNLRETAKKIASHLNKTLNDHDVNTLCEFLSFKNFKENKGCNFQEIWDIVKEKDYFKKNNNYFIRKGQVGDHINYMSQEMIGKFDKWIEENTKGTDLTF